MRSLSTTPDWEARFFGARLARMDEDEVYSFDATNIATKAMELADAQLGKSKEEGYRDQIGLSLLLGHKSDLPVMFLIFHGNITDVATFSNPLSREILQGKWVFAAVIDRGYFSVKNLRQLKGTILQERSYIRIAARSTARSSFRVGFQSSTCAPP